MDLNYCPGNRWDYPEIVSKEKENKIQNQGLGISPPRD